MSRWYEKNKPGGPDKKADPPTPKLTLPDVGIGRSNVVGEPMMAPVGEPVSPPDAEPSGTYKDIPFFENEDGGFGAVLDGAELTSTSRKGIKNAIKRALAKNENEGGDDESGIDDTSSDDADFGGN